MTKLSSTSKRKIPSLQKDLRRKGDSSFHSNLLDKLGAIERPASFSRRGGPQASAPSVSSRKSGNSKIRPVVRRGILKTFAESGRAAPRRIRSTPGSEAVTGLADRLVCLKGDSDALPAAEGHTKPRFKLPSLASEMMSSAPSTTTCRRAITLVHRDQAELCRLLVDGQGHVHETMSIALSDIARESGRTDDTLRQYESAFVWFFEPVVAAYPDLFDRLLRDVSTTRATLAAALSFQGFEVKPSRYADGSFRVRPPQQLYAGGRLQIPNRETRDGLNGASNVKRSDLALLMLRECFDSLIMRGRWQDHNPLRVNSHEQLKRLMNGSPMPSWASPSARYSGNVFNLRHYSQHYASRDTSFHKDAILNAALDFPAGIAFVTQLLADVGARISEPTALTLLDWVSCGANREIWSPNKGSRGCRTKILIMSKELAQKLPGYIDGERARFSKASMTLIQELAANGPNQPPQYAELLAEPLFLSPKGRQISPHLYRAQYFRLAMKRIGLPDITPHRLRHEHALRSLLAIRRVSNTPEIEAARIAEYAMLQGWQSGPAMAHYYAPQFRQMTQREMADTLYADSQREEPFAKIVEPMANPLITRQHRELRQLCGEAK